MFKNGYKPVNLWTKYNVAYIHVGLQNLNTINLHTKSNGSMIITQAIHQ